MPTKKKLTALDAKTGIEQIAIATRENKTPADEAFLLGAWAAHIFPELNHALIESYLRVPNPERSVQMPGEKLWFLNGMYGDMNEELKAKVASAEVQP